MGIFGGSSSSPTKINGIRVTQSKQGYPLPVVMGQNKIQQSLIWMDGLHSVKDSSGGKGGGKGGSEYLYTADVIAALCSGNVTAIGNVWSGQTWLSTTNGNEVIGALANTVYATQGATANMTLAALLVLLGAIEPMYLGLDPNISTLIALGLI
jgi:hypothetical protein